jgi:hypothetical protein
MNELDIKDKKVELSSLYDKEPVISGEYYVIDGMRLNRVESAIVDLYVSLMDRCLVRRWFNRKLGLNVSQAVIDKRLGKEHVRGVIARELGVRGYGVKEWKVDGMMAKDYRKKVDFSFWDKLGKAVGAYDGRGEGVVVSNQILFTQSDGSK